jgi:tryptophan synthase beta chain
VIGAEARRQILAQAGRLPDAVVACVGGGSNAIGIFDAFVGDAGVRLIGVEAGGEGTPPHDANHASRGPRLVAGRHAARFAGGAEGVLQGTRTWLLQDADGNVQPTHSVSAGLDYAAVGPEHAWLHSLGRAEYTWADDRAALAAFHQLTRLEGIMPALESAHAIAHLSTLGPALGPGAIIVVNLSGRGDKDVHTVAERAGDAS